MTGQPYVNRTADLAAAIKLGLTEDEYEHIKQIQDREPTYVELYMYSLMWSEHCSYKHSRPHACGASPPSGPRVLQGPGENAGVIDVGDGWAVAFKMETHNHPTAIEPFQGAATGVGGIIRDIFTMGARPSRRWTRCASARSTSRASASCSRARRRHRRLRQLPRRPHRRRRGLLRAQLRGQLPHQRVRVGLMRDEHHARHRQRRRQPRGAHRLDDRPRRHRRRQRARQPGVRRDAEDKRPSVQVGDPFEEKLLIEACLELLHRKLVVSLRPRRRRPHQLHLGDGEQGDVGLDIDVDRVPAREDDMKPFEFMVSESQERMLAIVDREKIADVREVCEHWDLAPPSSARSPTACCASGGTASASPTCPRATLADDAPGHPHALREAGLHLDEVRWPRTTPTYPPAGGRSARRCCSCWPRPTSPARWIWEQYDHIVQANTVVLPGSDAAVLRIKDTERGIAFSSDCNGRYCYLDPYVGAKTASAEAARNVACSGALPAAITDCLNFGNPEKPEVYWQFEEAIEGMAEACEALDTPVVSGNVSFYNESFGQPIYPTPMVGMLGIFDDVSVAIDAAFKDEGDVVVLLGETPPGWTAPST